MVSLKNREDNIRKANEAAEEARKAGERALVIRNAHIRSSDSFVKDIDKFREKWSK